MDMWDPYVNSVRANGVDADEKIVFEAMMAIFTYQYERPARKHFRWWYNWAVRSRLAQMKEVAKMPAHRVTPHGRAATTARSVY
jgi:hypothetical protein